MIDVNEIEALPDDNDQCPVDDEAAGEVGGVAPEFGSIDGVALLDDLCEWFGRYLVVADEQQLRLLAVWVLHTYLCEELYTSPRLLIDSIAPGSGKTTLLEHLERLCRNGMLAVSVSSAALIPRILETQSCTVLLDEIQRTLVDGKPECDALFALLNSGYRVGAKRPVLVQQGKSWVARELPTFAPLAMAGNSPRLPQDTVDRSIRLLLMPDAEGIAEDSDWETLTDAVNALQMRIAVWADSVRAHVKEVPGELPTGCKGRLREKWRPLMRVVELTDPSPPSVWRDAIRAMAEDDLADQRAQNEAGLRHQTPGLVLLQDLACIWPADEFFVPTERLIELLIGHNHGYWGPGINFGGAPRKALNAVRIGRMIKQATNTTSRRPGGGGTARGYERGQFDRAWRAMAIPLPDVGTGTDAGAGHP